VFLYGLSIQSAIDGAWLAAAPDQTCLNSHDEELQILHLPHSAIY
jgi:hypothetical protein